MTKPLAELLYLGPRCAADMASVRRWVENNGGRVLLHDHRIIIQSADGEVWADPGDWIATDMNGRFWIKGVSHPPNKQHDTTPKPKEIAPAYQYREGDDEGNKRLIQWVMDNGGIITVEAESGWIWLKVADGKQHRLSDKSWVVLNKDGNFTWHAHKPTTPEPSPERLAERLADIKRLQAEGLQAEAPPKQPARRAITPTELWNSKEWQSLLVLLGIDGQLCRDMSIRVNQDDGVEIDLHLHASVPRDD